MTIRLQDTRANLILSQIEAVYDAVYHKPYTGLLEEPKFRGIVENGKINSQKFREHLQEIEKVIELRKANVLEQQVIQNISGVEWYTVECGGISIELPRIHENLKFIPSDKEILACSKSTGYEFLKYWNENFDLWRYDLSVRYCWLKTIWVEFEKQFICCDCLEIVVDDSTDEALCEDTCIERPTFTLDGRCRYINSTNYALFEWNNSIPYA